MQPQPVPGDEDSRLSTDDKLRLQAQLLNAVEQAILAIDQTGRIVFWNHFAEKLYGWSILVDIFHGVEQPVAIQVRDLARNIGPKFP